MLQPENVRMKLCAHLKKNMTYLQRERGRERERERGGRGREEEINLKTVIKSQNLFVNEI